MSALLKSGSYLTSVVRPSLFRTLASAAGQTIRIPYSPSLLNAAETKVTVLSNGMRVASENDFGETATVGVWIDAGSRYESRENNGVAHYLEHLAFKGTPRRPQRTLEIEIENLGAHLNAYTSREQTVYFAKVIKRDVPLAVEILGDILQNSTISSSSVEAERSVILTEMEKVEEQAQELVFDHLHCIAFEGGNLGTTILGPIENIKKFKRDDLQAFIREHYTGPRMVLAAAGGINHDELVKMTERVFKGIPSHSNKKPFEPSRFIPGEYRLDSQARPDLHVAMSVEGVSWTSPDYIGMMTLQFLLGTWDRAGGGGKNLTSSLLGASQYEISSYTTFNTCYADTGLFGFYLTTHSPDKIKDMLEYFVPEWVRPCFNPQEVEVERAKAQLKAAFLLHLDGTSAICEDIGRQLVTFGRRITPLELNARIDAVTTDTIRNLAHKYLVNKQPAIVAYGPLQALPPTGNLRQTFHNAVSQPRN